MYCHLVKLATSKTKSGRKRQKIYLGGYPIQFMKIKDFRPQQGNIYRLHRLHDSSMHLSRHYCIHSIYIKAFEKLSRVSLYQRPHFYSWVLLILCPPDFQLFPAWEPGHFPYNQLTHFWLSAFYSTTVASFTEATACILKVQKLLRPYANLQQ